MLWNLANHEAEVGKPPETILPDVHLVTALAQASAANQFITEYGWNGSQGTRPSHFWHLSPVSLAHPVSSPC